MVRISKIISQGQEILRAKSFGQGEIARFDVTVRDLPVGNYRLKFVLDPVERGIGPVFFTDVKRVERSEDELTFLGSETVFTPSLIIQNRYTLRFEILETSSSASLAQKDIILIRNGGEEVRRLEEQARREMEQQPREPEPETNQIPVIPILLIGAVAIYLLTRKR